MFHRSKLNDVLEHFQEYGISCGTMSYSTAQQGCILSALAVAHRKTTWPDLGQERTVIYGAKGSHRKDVRRLADVIRERHPVQFGQYSDIKCCWKFNDYFASRNRSEIIRVFEIAIGTPDIQAGQIGEPQRKIILIPEEAPDIPPAPAPAPAPVKVPEKEPVPV